jgi:hypothetical protein
MESSLMRLGAGFLLLALGISSLAGAQPAPAYSDSQDLGFTDFSFGVKAGISFAQHVGTEERDADYTVSSTWRRGFAGGAFLTFPVTSRFAVQQEVLYVQKGSKQDIGVSILDIPTVLHVTYDMDYVEIPVLLKLAWMKWEQGELFGTAGTVLAIKVKDRYRLEGLVTDGVESIPLSADSDMSEVDMFDFSLTYGFGLEFPMLGRIALLEYRFTMGMNTLYMPTYAYVPFEDDYELVDNEPVPLKNQCHYVMFGIAF